MDLKTTGLDRLNHILSGQASPAQQLAQSIQRYGPETQPATPPPDYGLREDGTSKGRGYFGELPMRDGSDRVATEISIGVDFDGKERLIPSLVPTLSPKEIDYLLKGKAPTKQIMNKAVEFARGRIKAGLSPFAD